MCPSTTIKSKYGAERRDRCKELAAKGAETRPTILLEHRQSALVATQQCKYTCECLPPIGRAPARHVARERASPIFQANNIVKPN